MPAGSACRTRGGKTAAKYHTPRFVLVPALREELEVLVPADRYPGRARKQGPALAVVPSPRTIADAQFVVADAGAHVDD
ncbi:zinc finger domain-containing protein [Streptomyces sp. NPDC055109]